MPDISRRTILRSGAFTAAAVLTTRIAGQPGVARAADSDLQVAYNDLVITPHAPPWPSLWMSGYGWGKRSNNGAVARDLRAHCVVFHDSGSPNVLLRLDVVGIPRDVHQEIRRRVVEEEQLVADSDFMISVSHTHSGPCVGDTHLDPFIMMGLDPADIDAVNGSTYMLMDVLVDLVRTTVQEDPADATLHYGVGQAELGRNRAGLDWVLTDVPVLLVRNGDNGDPFAVLFGYACHPVSRGIDSVFDSDFTGAAAEIIEDRLGIMALFFQGLAGDQEPVGDKGPGLVEELGDGLAQAVIDVVEQDDLTQVTGPFRTAITEVDLPLALDLTDDDVVADLRDRYQERLDDNGAPDYLRRHAQVIVDRIDAGALEASIPMPMQVWHVAGLTIVALAHEVLSTFDLLIRQLGEELGVGNLWIMSYANETQCYVAADDKLWIGGYEAGWTDDPSIVGDGTSTMVYGWASPLRSSPPGTDPAAPDATETVVLAGCRELLTQVTRDTLSRARTRST